MYKIIGADGKEYGPISVDQLGQWIAEGRANAQTQVLPEGGTEWKAIAEVPELAHLVSPAPTSPAAAPAPTQFVPASPNAVNMVNGPAIGLIVVAILGFVLQAFGLVWKLAFSAMAAKQMAQQPWGNMYSGSLAIITGIIGLVTSGIILFGGLKMKNLENYGLAMAASIIVMIPCVSPCCLLGIPAGIWAITVLVKPEVKSAFH